MGNGTNAEAQTAVPSPSHAKRGPCLPESWAQLSQDPGPQTGFSLLVLKTLRRLLLQRSQVWLPEVPCPSAPEILWKLIRGCHLV